MIDYICDNIEYWIENIEYLIWMALIAILKGIVIFAEFSWKLIKACYKLIMRNN